MSAMTSLPAPFGPLIRTGTSACATRAAVEASACIASLSYTSPFSSNRAASSARAILGASRLQIEEVSHGRKEPRVVPGLRDVIGSAGFHELDGRLEMGPRRQQYHGQVRMLSADLVEERDAFLARGRLAPEVHVLDHEIHRLAREHPDPGRRRARTEHARAMHGQQDVERRTHGLAVVDHEYRALSQAVLKSLVLPVLHGLGC